MSIVNLCSNIILVALNRTETVVYSWSVYELLSKFENRILHGNRVWSIGVHCVIYSHRKPTEKLFALFCIVTRFAIFFPLRTPICVNPGSDLDVHFWRCCGLTKVKVPIGSQTTYIYRFCIVKLFQFPLVSF